jgi:hypothetical protein
MGTGQVGIAEVCARQSSTVETCKAEVGPAEVRSSKMALDQRCSTQISPCEADMASIGWVGKVTKDDKGCLDVAGEFENSIWFDAARAGTVAVSTHKCRQDVNKSWKGGIRHGNEPFEHADTPEPGGGAASTQQFQRLPHALGGSFCSMLGAGAGQLH